MNALFRALLLASFLAPAATSAAPPAAPRRVAVLDFNARWASGCATAQTDAQQERCEMLRLFADQARGGALAVLRPPAFVVMTRENTAQILKDMGGQCSEGECEVETARLLGASVVVSGEVSFMEGTWLVSLKVHDVATAALLGTGDTEGKSKLEAFRNVRAETERMLKAANLQASQPATAPPTVAPPPPAAKVEPTEPPPAEVAPVAEPPRTEEVAAKPSGPHRWWGQLLAGVPIIQSADPGFDTSANEPNAGIAMAGRAGFQWTPSWSVEATLAAFEAPGYDTGSAAYSLKFVGASVGGAWSPAANRYFSVGAGLGVGSASASVTLDPALGGKVDQAETIPWFHVDLRGEYPLGDFSLGLQTGLVLFPVHTIEVPRTGGGWVQFNPGAGVQLVPLQLSVKYRFM